jgi:hypothetical protein
MDQQYILSVRRLDPSYVRCFLVAAFLAFLCFALVLSHLWRSAMDRDGELFNKHEWSIVQALEIRWRGGPATIATIPNALDSPDYDAIVLPQLDGQGSVVILSNAVGKPRIKAFLRGPLSRICPADYAQIKASVRLNAEVEALLQALTTPDCGQ